MKEGIGEWGFLHSFTRKPWHILEAMDPKRSYTQKELVKLIQEQCGLGLYSSNEIIHSIILPLAQLGDLIPTPSCRRYRSNPGRLIGDFCPPWRLTSGDAMHIPNMKKMGERARGLRNRIRDIEKEKLSLRERLLDLSEEQTEIDKLLEDPVLLRSEDDLAVLELLQSHQIKVRR